MDYVTHEMILYALTSFGGAIIYIGNNHELRVEAWRVATVLITGLLVGATLTIPLHQWLVDVFPNFPLNASSRLGFALLLGFVAPYLFNIINKTLQKLEKDPSVIWKGIMEFLKRNINKHEFAKLYT